MSVSIAKGPAATAPATASPSASRNSSTWSAVAALSERWIVGWCPPKDSCGWTYQPARVIASVIVKTSQVPSVAKATSVDSGRTTTRSALILAIPSTNRSTASSTFRVRAR